MKIKCPYCNYKLDTHYNSQDTSDKVGPKDNDYGFCIKCGEVFTFYKNKPKKINYETLEEEYKQEINRVTEAWRKMKTVESLK